MFRNVIKRVIINKTRNFATSSAVKSDGDNIDKFAEQGAAREGQYFNDLQNKQLAALMKKTAKVEVDLQDEVDELEGKMAALKTQLNKKKKQMDELKSDE